MSHQATLSHQRTQRHVVTALLARVVHLSVPTLHPTKSTVETRWSPVGINALREVVPTGTDVDAVLRGMHRDGVIKYDGRRAVLP